MELCTVVFRWMKVFWGAAFITLLGSVTSAQATGLAPNVQQGVDWLTAQIQSDGSLAKENSSVATPFQARDETAISLAALATAPASLTSAIAANTDANVEYTARRILAAGSSTQATDVASLLSMQSADGGWGLDADFQSDPLDTAFALMALASAGNAPQAVVSSGLSYLSQSGSASSGWGVNGQSSVYVTSYILLAASAWSTQYSTASISSAASTWLIGQQTTSQSYSSTLDNALALRALATQTGQSAILQPVVSALNSSQLADGSWADDPYITALALRAIWFASQAPSAPTTGDVKGKVVDQSTGLAVSGATVQLVENSSSAASTAADGSFTLGGISPASYTLRVTMLGYQVANVTIQIVAGQVANVGNISLVPAPLTASVSGVVEAYYGQPLQNALVAIGSSSTFTDATGAYQLAGLSPGAVTITVSLNGYQTVTAHVSLVAGNSYLFSPTLYSAGTTPPATSLQGLIVDSNTTKPIIGASVVLNGATQTTDATGKFVFSNISAGAFSLSVSATGYLSATATGTTVAGLNDVGKIALTPAPVTSTLSGTVTDADTHSPIVSASIAVQGQSLTASTDAGGKYSIAGIVGTKLTLYVSATGYLSQTLSATLPQVGNATLDIQLTKPGASGITLESVQMSKPLYAPSDTAKLDVVVKNSTANAAAAVIAGQVFDAQHNVAFVFQGNASAPGVNPPNLPLIVPASNDLDVPMQQVMLRQAAGSYSVHVQAIDPSGLVLAEGDTQFSVAAESLLAGGLIPSPPLTQLGTGIPVKLSADLTNVGNQPIPAGSLDLKIVLQNADSQTTQTTQASVTSLVSGTPLNSARGLVADGAGNLYTVNYVDGKLIKTDSTGTSSILATLPSYVATSLARDAQGNFWVGTNNGKIYQVSPAGAATAIPTSNLSGIQGIDVDANGNLVLTGYYSSEQRLVLRSPSGQESVLLRNGLSQPYTAVKDDAGNYVVTNYGDGTLSKVSSSTGAITAFASGLSSPQGIARDAQGNFYVANTGNNTIAKVDPTGQVSTYATGLNQPIDLKLDSNGNLFVSNQGNNSLVKVLPNGTVQMFAQGVASGPQGMKYDSAGSLWIANDDGSLRKLDAQNVASVVATGLATPRGVAIDSSGNILVANYSNGTVTKTTSTGTVSLISGLINPYGVALDGSSDAYVTEAGANRISYFGSTGSQLGTIESYLNSPNQVRVGPSGEIYVLNSDSITVVKNGSAQFLTKNFTGVRYIVPDPVNGGVVALTGYDVYRIASDGTKTHINASSLPFYAYGLGMDGTGGILLLDYSNKRIQKIDAAGNLSTYASLPDYSQILVTDLSGNIYIRTNSGIFYSISSAGVATQIAVTLNEYIYNVNSSSDGKLLVTTNYARAYAIDPATGVATQIASNIGYGLPITRDAAGQLFLADSSNQELRGYDATGQVVSTLVGFISPHDIVWTGSDFRFVDSGSRLYSMQTGGTYPAKLGTWDQGSYLAWSNGQLYGAVSAYVYVLNGTSGQVWQTVPNASSLNGGIAARTDGALTVSENSSSRVITLGSNKSLLSDFAGIVRPSGLAFDSQDRLYVANYGANTIARFDLTGSAPTTFAKIYSPRFLAFDSANNLLVSRSGGVDKVDSTGTVTAVSNSLTVNGLIVDGTQLLGFDGSSGQLDKWDGTNWNVFAAGLSQPKGVHAGANGDIYVANYGNKTVVKYNGGALGTIATNLPNVNVVTLLSDGNVYAAGDSGLMYQIAPDGTKTDLKVGPLANYWPFYGIAGTQSGAFFAVNNGTLSGKVSDSIITVHLAQPVTPPAPGTIVFQTTVPMPTMPSIDGVTHLDLGQWQPTFGGDFVVSLSRTDVIGGASNFVHVGPAATGTLIALNPSLPPGDQTEHMCMSLSGADFTALARPEVASFQKYSTTGTWVAAMGADPQGNIYFSPGNFLNGSYNYGRDPQGNEAAAVQRIDGPIKRIGVDGTLSVFHPGPSYTYGRLPVDDQGNVYIATSSTSIIKTTGNGDTPVATMSDPVVSMDWSPDGSLIVLTKTALYRVAKDGSTKLITPILRTPYVVQVGQGQYAYIQVGSFAGNDSAILKVDLSNGATYFLTGDAQTEFETEGSSVAVDCSEKLFVVPWYGDTAFWNQVGGEEKSLFSFDPQNKSPKQALYGPLYSSSLNDLDLIVYDRFKNQLLVWIDDGTYSSTSQQGQLWRLPMTCGAIGVQAHLVTVPGQTITGTSMPTSATIPLPNGGAEYVWSLKDVTASGQQVCFDTNLAGLQLGETRKALDSGYFTFQNSFAPSNVKVPLDVPSVHVDNLVQIAVATDKPDYLANATAQVTTTLTNQNAVVVTGDLTVNVYDAQSVLVGSVTEQNVSIPAGGSLPVTAPFSIGTILPAQYTAKASLTSNGSVAAQASATFNVLPDNVSASATSTISTDKQAYNPSDVVTISSRAISQSANILLSNLTLMVKVYDAGGTLQFTHGYSIAQLLPGGFLDFSVQEKLANAAAGTYTVKQDLLDAQDNPYNHVETTYTVGSTSDTGFGLIGQIAVTPKSLPVGQTLTLTATATNSGNGALDNIPLTISIVDPSQVAALQQFNQTSTLAVGASAPFNTTWVTQGSAGTTYFAVLTATVGSGANAKNLMLAFDTFTLSAPAIHLDAGVTISAGNPSLAALVLVDANVSADTTARITAALTALNYTPSFVNTSLDFANGVRSGAYQVYLLLATQVAPDATTLRLLREAVHRGEGVIASNGAAGLPDALAQITGLTASNALPVINAQALDILSTAPGGTAHIALSPSLASRVVVPTSAQTQATLTGRLPSAPDQGTLSDEVTNLGRVDIGYYGTDAGTGNTHLSLTSMGRIHNADGTDRYTIWRIRNSGATARSLILSSGSSYSLAFSITSYTDTFIASPVVAGTATHKLSEGSQTIDTQAALTSVFTDTRIVDVGDNPGAIALWANAINASDVLDWSGAQHQLHGAIHSNSDIQLAGAQNLIDGPVHYVTTFTNNGSQNTFTFQPRQVAAQPLPTLLNLDDFKPGGPVAAAVGSQYFDHTTDCGKGSWHLTPKDMPIVTGVHWIPCDLKINGNGAGGTVTLVTTGSIQIDGPSATFQPFYQGVQLATTQTGADTVHLSGNSHQYSGLIFVPHGTVQITGSSMNFSCSIIADQIRLAGSKTQIDARQCAYATVQRKSPAVLWNSFGGGHTAYSAFDWQSAISQYEATPGPLTNLFNNSAVNIAPTSIALRAGSVLPLTTTVTNKGDPFKGQLALAANDDSVFMPSTAMWPLDFTSQNLFTEKNNVRLGMSSSSTLTATVSATSPLVVNPLKTAASTVAHLPGESINDLIAAFNAISGRDTPLNTALTALQAAQTAMTGGNGEAALSSLLDAAEACGQSTNAQAEALRTRIDWVIWAGTH